ncbi:MAG: hypothetical protein LQ349_009023 [Xanthoria aureola]|nr:MAG: hypothetical protein LQ349_009023 [Xanthoria aureola]
MTSYVGRNTHRYTHSEFDITPAISAPLGQYSNLVDPPNVDSTIIACTVLLLVLSTPLVALRLYTRIKIKPKPWWDDATCLLGWAFMIALGCLNIHMLAYGSGSDLWNVTMHDWIYMKSHFDSILIVARVGLTLTKISLLLFYQRVFMIPGNRFSPIYWAIWITFWCNCLLAVAYVVALSTQCMGKPDLGAEGGQCIDKNALIITSSFINVAIDFSVLIIPIVVIWGLQIPIAKKRRLSGVFVLGGLAVLASVARLGYQLAAAKNPNRSIAFTINSLLKLIEQSIGVMVSCLPVLPAFYQRFWGTEPASRSKILGKSKSQRAASPNLLGYQRRGRGFPSTPSTQNSKSRDPFPVQWTKDDKMTTRDGYEELTEFERGAPEPSETTKGWGVAESRLSRVVERAGPVPQAHKGILKGTEIEITSERR